MIEIKNRQHLETLKSYINQAESELNALPDSPQKIRVKQSINMLRDEIKILDSMYPKAHQLLIE